MSGILKSAVEGRVTVGPLGLAGDEQADSTVHGGRDKAVYAYPVEHYAWWIEQRRASRMFPELPYGSFGENLTLSGLLERELFVGDLLLFPDCTLRVTQPRSPCFKFNAVMDDPRAHERMRETGYSGFYLAVERAGTLAAGEEFDVAPGQRRVPLMSLFRFA